MSQSYGQMLALFTAIEASRKHNGSDSSSSLDSKSVKRGHRELKGLACSINYDWKGGHSSRGKSKGRGSIVINEAYNYFLECERAE
jgi:hypothetical protein